MKTERPNARRKMDHASLAKDYAYCPETGTVTRKRKTGVSPAGSQVGQNEMGTVSLRGKKVAVARFAFFLHAERWPKDGHIIYHLNGDKQDNRWENLAEVTRAETRRLRGST